MGLQEAVGFGDVNPLQQVRVAGGVVASIRCLAPNTLMDAPNSRDDGLGVLDRAERRRRKEGAGALKPTPGIALVARMSSDPSHGQRVQGLEKQRTDSCDEHRRVTVDPPDRVGLGEPSLARVAPDELGPRRVVLARNPVAERVGDVAAQPVVERAGGVDKSGSAQRQ